VQQLVGAGELGKRSWNLEHWKGTIQTDDAQDFQHCAFALVKAAAEAGLEAAAAAADTGFARLESEHSWSYVDSPVQVQVEAEQ